MGVKDASFGHTDNIFTIDDSVGSDGLRWVQAITITALENPRALGAP